jgi:glutathione S-transferase
MKLYYAPGACSLAPHIILRELGLPFDLIRVDTRTHRTVSGDDYYAVNPKGSVPLLELDSGERLSEGPVIVRYLCDTAGREDLMPAPKTLARYRVEEWQNYVTSELHKSFSPLFNPAFDDAAKLTTRGLLRKKYEWLSAQLADRDYLAGSTFTGADAYFFTVTRWAAFMNVDLAGLEPIARYMARVNERASVREALKAEGF